MCIASKSRVAVVLETLFDCALLAVVSLLGAMVSAALLQGMRPDMQNLARSVTWLAVAVVIALAGWVWIGTKGRLRPVSRGLVIGGMLLVGGVVCLWIQAFRLELERAGSDGVLAVAAQMLMFLLMLLVCFMARHFALDRGWWRWSARAVLAVAVAVVVVYLKADVEESPSVARNRQAVSGYYDDEASYLLTLRYSPKPGAAMVMAELPNSLDIPSDEPKRSAYLKAHREEIEANWAALTDVRAWWSEMAALPALGDRTSGQLDQPFLKFAPVRAYTTYALAIAELRALDGDVDGAMSMVSDVFKVGANLEFPTCTLVRGMIAVVVQRSALKSASFIFEHAEVSRQARRDFAALLAARHDPADSLRRMLLAEGIYTENVIRAVDGSGDLGLSVGEMGEWARIFGGGVRWLAFDAQDTINRIQDEMEIQSALAAARDLEALRRRDDEMWRGLHGRFQIKNIGGRMMVSLMMPAYTSITKSYWEKEDLRQVMLTRLAEVTN